MAIAIEILKLSLFIKVGGSVGPDSPGGAPMGYLVGPTSGNFSTAWS